MDYIKKEVKKGITLHQINTNKFKTNLIAIFLSTPLTRENVTYNAVLSSVLRRGTKNIQNQEELSKKMEEMYGAEYNCGVNKIGNDHVLKFYMETINDDFLPQEAENMLKTGIDMLCEIAFDPLVKNGGFDDEYVSQEKENVKQIIEAKKDNKAGYAAYRCLEEMYKNEPAGLYRFGYVEDMEKINSKNLYEYFLNLLKQCKIDIFVSGDLNNVDLIEIINNNENIKKLEPRDPVYIINKPEKRMQIEKEKYVEEKLDVTQGKLVIGYDVILDEEELKCENLKYIGMVYNAILGGSANSKLFQNVREKASLPYTVNSGYAYYCGNIFINAGIDIGNFQKTVDIIKKQIENMEKGEFSEQDIKNVKNTMISNIKSIDDEQDTEIIYFLGQELSNIKNSLEQYIEKVQDVKKSEIVDFAKNVKINMIYFLKN